MTSSSERGHIIRGLSDAATMFTVDGPADAGHARDLINNANHLIDESTQVVANLPGPFLTNGDALNTFLPALAPRIMFPIPIRSDGSSVRLAVSLRAKLAFAGTLSIRFGIQAARRAQMLPQGEFSSALVTTTSTVGELVGTTTPLYLPASWVDAARRRNDYDALSDRMVTRTANLSPAEAPCLMVTFDIFTSITVDKVSAELSSISIREYIG